MFIDGNVFSLLDQEPSTPFNGGVAGGKSFHGKEKPSVMVAEGSFDPSTELHSPFQREESDHDLQLMVGSRPMERGDLQEYLHDVLLVDEDAWNNQVEKGHRTHLKNRSVNAGDVRHQAYTARANSQEWRYNGSVTPGYAQQEKPKNLPRLAGEAKARHDARPYYQTHPGLYGDRTGRGLDQHTIGAANYMDSHCEEPKQVKIVRTRNTKRGKTWGHECTYSNGIKTWEPFQYQTGKGQQYSRRNTAKLIHCADQQPLPRTFGSSHH